MTRWTLEFTVTPADIRDMNAQYFRESMPRFTRVMDVFYLLILVGLALTFVGFSVISVLHGRYRDLPVQFVISAGAVALMVWFHRSGGSAAQLGRQMRALGAHRFAGEARLEADDRSVVMQAPTGVFELEWSRVNRVVATQDYVILIFKGGKGVWAPSRAFLSPDDRERFLAFARQQAQVAHAIGAIPSA